jgi:hypothetical protein
LLHSTALHASEYRCSCNESGHRARAYLGYEDAEGVDALERLGAVGDGAVEHADQ